MLSSTRNKEKPENSGMPRELAEAIASAEGVLKHADYFSHALAETGESLPACLSERQELSRELREVEITGADAGQVRARLDALIAKQAGECRRRIAASEALMRMDGELVSAAAKVDEAKKIFARPIFDELFERVAANLREREALRAEIQAYEKAFGVKCPPPLEPAESPEPAVLPAVVVKLLKILDRLEQARVLSSSLHRGTEWTRNYFAVAREKGFRSELSGVFTVTKEFDCLGSHFRRGMLVNRDLLGEGLIERHWRGRTLSPVPEAGIAASYSAHTAA
jgi:hypothetical protein